MVIHGKISTISIQKVSFVAMKKTHSTVALVEHVFGRTDAIFTVWQIKLDDL